MKTISFSCFVYEEGKSGISEYINSVLNELIKEHHIIIHILAKEHSFLKKEIARSVKIQYKIYPDILGRPVLNLLFHTLVLPFIFIFEKTEIIYLPAANRRQLLFYPRYTIGIVHDLAELHLTQKFGFLRWLRMRFYTPLFLKGIDHLIAISNTTKQDLIQFYNLKEDTITVVYNGVKAKNKKCDRGKELVPRLYSRANAKIEDKIPQPSTFKLQRSHFSYFLYVSRIEHPGKNHIRLIEAYEKLTSEIRDNYDLIFAGNLKENHQTVIDRIKSSPQNEKIHLLGFVSDEKLQDLYNGASLYICPSLYEGFGLTVLEAMSNGIPVISSTAGALPEICGDAALFFDPYSVDEIRMCIEKVILNYDCEKSITNKANEHIKRFSWVKHVKTIIQGRHHE